jgi:hypothetical protein
MATSCGAETDFSVKSAITTLFANMTSHGCGRGSLLVSVIWP